jgi:hypothetical protein
MLTDERIQEIALDFLKTPAEEQRAIQLIAQDFNPLYDSNDPYKSGNDSYVTGKWSEYDVLTLAKATIEPVKRKEEYREHYRNTVNR